MSQQTVLVEGPQPVETTDLHFKLHSKLKIFESSTKYEDGNYSLLAVSQLYGLIFVGNLNGFTVMKTKITAQSFTDFTRRDIPLSFAPTHIVVDNSQKFLAVICKSRPGAILNIYHISSFANMVDVTPIKVISLSKLVKNLVAEVMELTWQPNADSSLMFCMSDGSVLSLAKWMEEGPPVYTLPSTTLALCCCWSPKGKQVVIGNANGTLSQYKPDLKLVKTLPAPPLYQGGVAVISVLWISNYQFAVAYGNRSCTDSFPVIVIVNAPQHEPVTFLNFDDITFSSVLFRNHQMYMNYQSAWNLLFVSSANSIEVAVLRSKDNSNWEQWLLGDASRAELPLNADKQETFPLGFALDFTSTDTILWGEETLPPMPRLILLSDEGILCIFNVVNAIPNAAQLCSPPKENVNDALFTIKTSLPAVREQPQPLQVPQDFSFQQKITPPAPSFSVQTTLPFGGAKLSHTFGSTPSFGGFITVPQIPAAQPSLIEITPIIGVSKDAPLISQPPTLTSQQTITSTRSSLAPEFKFSTNGNQFTGNVVSLQDLSTVSLDNVLKPAGQTDTLFFTEKTNLLQSTGIKQPETESKPAAAVVPAEPTQTPPPESESPPPELVDETGSKINDTRKRKSPGGSPGPKLPVVDDSVYWDALQDEIDHFNSELEQLSSRVSSLNVQVGSDKEKEKLKKTMDGLHDFWKELKDTTVSQTNEIHSVVTDLMESFAWLEDARSRNMLRKNPDFIELKKSETLDPISARHMADIAHYNYYIETQLKQLTTHVEKEWMEHQENYRSQIKNQMSVPPLDEIHKTVHFQLMILNKQRILIEEIKEKMAMKKRKNRAHVSINNTSGPIVVKGTNKASELSKLADNLLQLKINKEDAVTEVCEATKAMFQRICARSQKLTLEKQAALRDILSERDIVKIRGVKRTLDTLESSFFRVSLEGKGKTTMAEKPEENQVSSSSPAKNHTLNLSKEKPKTKPPKSETLPPPQVPVEKEKVSIKKPGQTDNVFVFGTKQGNKPIIPLTVKSLSKQEEKSPLVSLTGIVCSIGKENETKPKPPVPSLFFETPKSQTEAATKEPTFSFGVSISKPPQTKPEEVKPAPAFSFPVTKPSEFSFGSKMDSPKFDMKPIFGIPNSSATVSFGSKEPEVAKTTAPSFSVSATSITTTSSPFTLSFTPTTTQTSTPLPKINLLFGSSEKENSSFGAKQTTANTFLMPSSSFSTSSTLFGVSKPFPSGTPTTSCFGTPKTNSEVTASITSPIFTAQTTESKTTPKLEESVPPTSTTSETVIKTADVPVEKTEIIIETKASPKMTIAPTTVFGVPPVSIKPITEAPSPVSSSIPPPNVQISLISQSNTATSPSSIFPKLSVPTTAETVSTSTPVSSSAATSLPVSITSSFSTSPLVFDQVSTVIPSSPSITTSGETTATTITTTSASSATTSASTVAAPAVSTAATTSSSASASPVAVSVPLGSSATTSPAPVLPAVTSTIAPTPSAASTNIFGQVSSATPTNIFGEKPATPTATSGIFGDSTPNSKPVFGQASNSTTPTSGSIFGNTAPKTPTINIFGEISTPTSSPSVFGQKPDAVAQTTNIFGQLLSDNNRSTNVFGTSATTPTTTTSNIFSSSKNIFGNDSTTSAPLFGNSSSSIFPQTTSVFGQPTTSSSIFGQSQTAATSNSFFGQSICSPFGGGTSVTSNQSTFDSGGFNNKPVFGQSLFGQNTSNTSNFGSSMRMSLFSNVSTSTPSGGNVFQTSTTNTFGTGSGPFSSKQGSVAETGFRPANSFQEPLGGFGSPPVFGAAPTPAPPTFGASPTFSSPGSFGSLPTFASPTKPFGSTGTGTFGLSPGHSTFENLAKQETLGFGNLAQQSQNQRFGGFGSAPTFENKSAFGGTAFSNWRSND